MPVPKPKMKIKADGIEYIEDFDKAEYYIEELTRAALRDVGKFIRKATQKAYYSRFNKKTGSTFYGFKGSFGYWVRKKETDLLVGINVAEKDPQGASWFANQELGTESFPKLGIFFNTVMNNIDEIRKIEAEYLSYIDDELRAAQKVDEEESLSEGDEE